MAPARAPADSSWLNRVEARSTALRRSARGGTDGAGHRERGGTIRRHLVRRSRRTADVRLRVPAVRANVA